MGYKVRGELYRSWSKCGLPLNRVTSLLDCMWLAQEVDRFGEWFACRCVHMLAVF